MHKDPIYIGTGVLHLTATNPTPPVLEDRDYAMRGTFITHIMGEWPGAEIAQVMHDSILQNELTPEAAEKWSLWQHAWAAALRERDLEEGEDNG